MVINGVVSCYPFCSLVYNTVDSRLAAADCTLWEWARLAKNCVWVKCRFKGRAELSCYFSLLKVCKTRSPKQVWPGSTGGSDGSSGCWGRRQYDPGWPGAGTDTNINIGSSSIARRSGAGLDICRHRGKLAYWWINIDQCWQISW